MYYNFVIFLVCIRSPVIPFVEHMRYRKSYVIVGTLRNKIRGLLKSSRKKGPLALYLYESKINTKGEKFRSLQKLIFLTAKECFGRMIGK